MSYAKRPSGSSLKRDDATAPRAPYAQRRHSPRRSLAITRVAACSEKPSTNADNGAACKIDRCGDGLVNNAGAEQCDDGNAIDSDGCTA